ncbi:MAG TPA: hypothetical protein VEW93_03005 [Acidimicrobiales bacterium]|nr:hypothetical protein [Acidimicrobiales bacterium]
MARRIEIELTSTRDDGSWTWRAAGARQPKGVVASGVLPGAPSVGDVLRVEVEIGLDGTEITAVLPGKGPRAEPERLELVRRDLRDEDLVTSKLVGKRGGRDRDRDRDGDRRGGRGRSGPGGPGGRDGRPGGDRGRSGGDSRPDSSDGRPGGRPASDRSARHPRDGAGRGDAGPRDTGRPDRPRRRPDDAKPRPKRLRPQRAHRRAVLDTLEAHERPIAEEVLRGGMAAVRQAVEKQNTQARAEGRPEVDAAHIEGLAERLLPRLRAADWRDRAEAALADLAELDLRDLRTVVAAAESAARDDEAKALAVQLREGLERRVEADQAAWLAEMAQLLGEGRVVRALRVSSRPPKAGSPLPPDLAARMVEAASASLTSDTLTERWATVLDALALSPVHAKVAPASVPEAPSDELKAVVAAAGAHAPLVAQALGVEPAPAKGRRPGRRGPVKGGPGSGGARPVPPPPPAPAPRAQEPTTEPAVAPEAQAPPAVSEEPGAATDQAAAPASPGPEVAEPAAEAPEAVPAEVPAAAPAPAEDGPVDEAPAEPQPDSAPVAEDPAPEPPSAPGTAEEPGPAEEEEPAGPDVETPGPPATPDAPAPDLPPEADPADAAGAEDTPVEPAVPVEDGRDEEDRGSQPASE